MRVAALLVSAFVLWAFLLIGVLGALADDDDEPGRVGRAPLFLLTARFPVDRYLLTAPRSKHAIAILWDVPRRRRAHLRAVLRRSPVTEVHIVLLNETCVRNRVCERRDALYGYTPTTLSQAVLSRDERLRRLVRAETRKAIRYLSPVIGSRAIVFNPLLETQLRSPEWGRVARWVKSVSPATPLIYNPVSNTHENRPILASFVEHHGLGVRCGSDGLTIANLDGSRCSQREMADWLARTRGCRLSLLWEPADNCRSSRETQFVPPTERYCAGDYNVIQRVLK